MYIKTDKSRVNNLTHFNLKILRYIIFFILKGVCCIGINQICNKLTEMVSYHVLLVLFLIRYTNCV